MKPVLRLLVLTSVFASTACFEEPPVDENPVEEATPTTQARPSPPPPPDPAPPALPSWPSTRPNSTQCETDTDCVYTNVNAGACCVGRAGTVYARDFVNWRSSWIRGRCPANDCVEMLQEPSEPCAAEARCVDGQCRDACD